MKEYAKRSKNGDAGEYFSAFKFTKIFEWPYRMLDVDLGVDAEIEILDNHGISTSDVIKIQVKTFDSINADDSKKIYVSNDHIEYWKKFCVPIVVVCVDLTNEKIYWKPVVATESYESGGQSKLISIDLAADELTSASKQRFVALATPPGSKNIEKLLNEARALHQTLNDLPTTCVDAEQLNKIHEEIDKFRSKIAEVDDIIFHFPWRAGILTRKEIEVMKRNVQITENNASYSYAVGVNGM